MVSPATFLSTATVASLMIGGVSSVTSTAGTSPSTTSLNTKLRHRYQQLTTKRFRIQVHLNDRNAHSIAFIAPSKSRALNSLQLKELKQQLQQRYSLYVGGGSNNEYQSPNFDADEVSKYDPTLMPPDNDDAIDSSYDIHSSDEKEEMKYLRNELIHLESLEELIQELEQYNENDYYNIDDEEDDDYDIGGNEYDEEDVSDDDIMSLWDEQSLEEILNNLPIDGDNEQQRQQQQRRQLYLNDTVGINRMRKSSSSSNKINNGTSKFYQNLEQVLMQGVVPVSAGVGSESLVGDFGFDPLSLSDKDLFLPTQNYLLKLLPNGKYKTSTTTINNNNLRQDQEQEEQEHRQVSTTSVRPKALILRDYREAEIRHGRLAMLAAMIWPIQEMVDKFVLPDDQFGPLLYGPVTLPYFPLFMTAIMLLLGYLDIYSQAIKDMDQIGDAFLPGDCFWDPLQILEGADNRVKRNMQERELFNGRAAMIAIGAFIIEESFTHKAIVDIGSNALLLQPAYEIPFIQRWLDEQFTISPPTLLEHIDSSIIPNDNDWLIDTLDTLIQTTFLLLA